MSRYALRFNCQTREWKWLAPGVLGQVAVVASMPFGTKLVASESPIEQEFTGISSGERYRRVKVA